MQRNPIAKHLLMFLTLIVFGIAFVMPADAAPVQRPTPIQVPICLPQKHIDNWTSRRGIEARGFNFDLIGPQANAQFGRNLGLYLAANPTNADYTASRITEVDTWKPIAGRVKCWQATEKKNVVAEFRVRFDQATTPAGLTENLFLWNAPFPSSTPEPARPVTTIGVSRNSLLGAPMYVAVVTQDLDYGTFAPPFVFEVQPMPAWLNASDWHRVRITLSQTSARIEVAQQSHSYETVLEATLLHPAEPLGFEMSVDNEVAPGVMVPVATPDGLDIDLLDIGYQRAR